MATAKDWATAETGMLVVLSLGITLRLFALWRMRPEATTHSTSPVHRLAGTSLSLARAYADRELQQLGSRQACPSQEPTMPSNTPSSRRARLSIRASRLRALVLKKHDPHRGRHRGRHRVPTVLCDGDSGTDDVLTDEEESGIHPKHQSTRPSAQEQQQAAACSARLDGTDRPGKREPAVVSFYALQTTQTALSSDIHVQQTSGSKAITEVGHAMQDMGLDTSYVPSWNTWGARVDAVLCSSDTDHASGLL